MNYPNGKKLVAKQRKQTGLPDPNYSNRGMSLEDDINAANRFYRETNMALIHKKPTPVQIVKVHYPKRSAAVITEAYFKQPSTTDYNGIYNGKYIDFEAKETRNKTSFPLANIHEHQVQHMQSVLEQKGICFLLIRFSSREQTFYFPADLLLEQWEKQSQGGRKSISYDFIAQNGYLLPLDYRIRIHYLAIIDQLYF